MTLLLPDAAAIAQQLQQGGIDQVVVHPFKTLESTSDWLREQRLAADSSATCTALCVTDSQIAGKGRRGKSWQTRPGNITFSLHSVSERQPQELMGLSLVTGIGVALALRDALSLIVELKWPNDVIHQNAKLGGLLTEILASSQNGPYSTAAAGSEIITGIGINVLRDPAVSSLGIGATSLEEAGASLSRAGRDRLIGAIAARVLNCHRQFEREGWISFEHRWEQFDWLRDKDVEIHREQSTEQGVARGVNHQGALLIEQGNEVTPLYGGNVSIRCVK